MHVAGKSPSPKSYALFEDNNNSFTFRPHSLSLLLSIPQPTGYRSFIYTGHLSWHFLLSIYRLAEPIAFSTFCITTSSFNFWLFQLQQSLQSYIQ
jgi:hypothetical protein